jgi:Spy/CpxP family protein refolding chaperone
MMRNTLLTAALAAVLLVGAAAPSQAQGQGQGQRGNRGGRGGFGGSSFLLQMPEVQKELALDPGQVELLKGLNGGFNRESFQGLSDDERRKKFTELRAQREKQVAEILNAKQVTRLKQLEIQQAGTRALDREDVATALKLTADQKAKIDAAQDAERTAMEPIFASFRGNNGQRPTDAQRDETRKKMADIRTSTETKILAVLTEPQKKQFESMKGAAFKFPEFRGRRGGNNN